VYCLQQYLIAWRIQIHTHHAPFLQLIYTSTPASVLSEDSLVEILKNAQIYNINNGISGFLLSTNDRLIQLIEGKTEDVTKLFDIISNDQRHHDIAIAYEGYSENRCMPFLGMGLCFNYLVRHLDHRFYFTKNQAKDFNGLIEGNIGQLFKSYLT
jgi:hypothetical protein